MKGLSKGKMGFVHQAALAALICAVAVAASAQSAPQSPEPAPIKPEVKTPTLGPTGREIKLADDTWFRFAVQVQAWAQAHQDRILQPDGSDGGYGLDLFCRRCRFFATGSVVKNVFFNFLFEAGNVGKADPVTGAKTAPAPQVLDAYGQVKFADGFWLSAGSILMPFGRNATQPTTTYLSLDNANIDLTPVLQGNSFVLRDLGIQANGFFLDNHLEYRVGVFQGSRQASLTTQSAGHNSPRLVTSLSYNLWDTETGYVNGGHYYGTKQIVGVMANWDYQSFRKNAPPAPGADKNAYMGMHGSVFVNYPLSGKNPKGGDEIAAVAEIGYYNGGFEQSAAGVTTNAGTYPSVLKQLNFLGEAAYYNHAGRFSVFGKYEMRKVDDGYIAAVKAASNQTWISGGAKYYLAPANMMYLTLQYERVINGDAPSTQQGSVNNITFAWQTILY